LSFVIVSINIQKSNWITAGIIKSITYTELKHTPQNDITYYAISVTLRVYKLKKKKPSEVLSGVLWKSI